MPRHVRSTWNPLSGKFSARKNRPSKPDNPGRPIVSACSCPTENISAYLDEVMAPFVKNLPTYVKDTNHALRIFDSFNFDESDARPRFLFTMDIKSLYTVIPNNGGLEALTYYLQPWPKGMGQRPPFSSKHN